MPHVLYDYGLLVLIKVDDLGLDQRLLEAQIVPRAQEQ